MQKIYAQMELADGTEHTERILLMDKRSANHAANVRKWDIEGRDQIDFHAVMAYSAAKRAGLTTSTFEEFTENELVDLFITDQEPQEKTSDTKAWDWNKETTHIHDENPI